MGPLAKLGRNIGALAKSLWPLSAAGREASAEKGPAQGVKRSLAAGHSMPPPKLPKAGMAKGTGKGGAGVGKRC